MSSHREAPGTSQDPVADSTDLYAFVSPDDPSTVTMICNYIPLEGPAAGPNFYEFGDDVLYSIHIYNSGDARARHRRTSSGSRRRSATRTRSSTTPARSASLDDPHLNKRQFYTRDPQDSGWGSTVLGARGCRRRRATSGRCSTPELRGARRGGRPHLAGRRTVFAGQRAEGFYVDLGAIFDLGDLRPFQQAARVRQPRRARTASTRPRGSTSTRSRSRSRSPT